MKEWNKIDLVSHGKGISEPLSKQINLLATLLGFIIKEQAGNSVFELVEYLRSQCKKANLTNNNSLYDTVREKLKTMEPDLIVWLIRAFTNFFHLVNQAERQEIIRINQERERAASPEMPRTESINEAIFLLKQNGATVENVISLLQQLDIQPTLTAHPTEARRRSIFLKQKKIGNLLTQLKFWDELTSQEREQILDDLLIQISMLMTTDVVRSERLTVDDEVIHGLYFITSTIWETVPRIY